MQKQILVTGGTGFIGSHTVVELVNSGYEPILIDNLYNSQISVLDGIKGITGKRPAFENFDLREYDKLQACCRKYAGIEAIIHFAALKAVGESVERPLDYYDNNLVSVINILRAMEEFRIKSLVFSSSCTVYGQPDTLPVTESSPIKPANSPYGNTKQIAEEIIRDTITANSSLQAISLRYFNPVGAHPSALIGELPVGTPQNLVPYITQTVIGLRNEVRVFGNDYDTPDGTGVRDYIYIVDLAKAHVVAIDRLIKGKNKMPCEVFNLGTGRGVSVLEIIHSFEKATGEKVNFVFKPRRAGDISTVYADTSLANNELGWKAEASLGETLLSAWKWEKHIRNKD